MGGQTNIDKNNNFLVITKAVYYLEMWWWWGGQMSRFKNLVNFEIQQNQLKYRRLLG